MKKKFLAFAAVAAFASATQAATLSWGARQITVDGSLLTGGTAYLFITEQSGDFGAPVTTVDAITALVENDGDYASLAAGNVGHVNNGMLTGATGYYANFGAGDSLSAFAVIFDADKSNYIVTSTQSTSWTSAVGAKTLQFGSLADATWKPVSVPEPGIACMALLGIGMMIKRRRA